MQGRRCAYCEAAITQPDCHIEHFEQRSRFAQGTFQWANLFGSCNRISTCGKHKDRVPAYPPSVLLKPDVEDPLEYLIISDGKFIPRFGLDASSRVRAEETIRIFNLNDPALVWLRRRYSAGYKEQGELLLKFACEFPEEEWRPIVHDELAQVADLPFVSAIRQILWRD